MSSKPRPIHSKPREINEEPCPDEPSSYDERAFLSDAFSWEAAEKFHKERGDLTFGAGTHHRRPSSSGVKSCRKSSTNLGHSDPDDVSFCDSESDVFGSPNEFIFPESQSCNNVAEMVDTGAKGRLNRSPNSYPTFKGSQRYGSPSKMTRTERFERSVSSVDEDSVLSGHSMSLLDMSSQGSKAGRKAGHKVAIPTSKSSSSLERKSARWHAKKRDRARRLKDQAILGMLEFGHDDSYGDAENSGYSLGGFVSSIEDKGPGTVDVGGQRGEQIEHGLRLARQSLGKKKLVLKGLNLTSRELPTASICSIRDLHKLSLSGNNLKHIPDPITARLSGLRNLDLQQCGLVALPDYWNMPKLRRLDLAHNRLSAFLSVRAQEALPELEYLDMQNNEICEWTLSPKGSLSNLQYINVNFNDLSQLPDELPRLKSLKRILASNNYITFVPERICRMALDELLVTPNPLIQPPPEDCERGIHGMRRYYNGLRKQQKKAARVRSKDDVSTNRERRDQTSPSPVSPRGAPLLALPSIKADEGIMSYAAAAAGNLPQRTRPLLEEVPGVSKSDVAIHKSPLLGDFLATDEHDDFFAVTEDILVGELPEEAMHVALAATADPNNRSRKMRAKLEEPRAFLGRKKMMKKKRSKAEETVGEEKAPPQAMLNMSLGDAATQISSDRADFGSDLPPTDLVNDTLKIIFVGSAYTGKTTIIKRLREGQRADIPKREERTIGVDIYSWNPEKDCITHGLDSSKYNTRIVKEDKGSKGNSHITHIQFSVWDFAGQESYHATHEIFFSRNALYIVVWDMAVNNKDVKRRPRVRDIDDDWIDSSDEEDDKIYTEREQLRVERALEQDIDDKVHYWVNCIQSRVPGAVILPVASFNDRFDTIESGGREEAKRRCHAMKKRLLFHQENRLKGLKARLEGLRKENRADSHEASRLMVLISRFMQPKLVFMENELDSVPRVSGTDCTGFEDLRELIINIATGRHFPNNVRYPLFRGHIGVHLPAVRLQIRNFVREMKAQGKLQVIEWNHFLSKLQKHLGHEVGIGDLSDSLQFLSRIGEISYFGECQELPHLAGSESSKTFSTDVDDMLDDDGTFVEISGRDDTYDPLKSNLLESKVSSMADGGSRVEVSRLSQFIFLNPKWIAATMGCILRHDLAQHLDDTRDMIRKKEESPSKWHNVGRGDSFHDANQNCPVITGEETRMLWNAHRKIVKAAERSQPEISSSATTAFEFMCGLLLHFKVFVPIDLTYLHLAFFGGDDFVSGEEKGRKASIEESKVFFLPSQLSSLMPMDSIWSYKCLESWKTCLSHSWLFPDSVPPGLFEHVTASVLCDLYALTRDASGSLLGVDDGDNAGKGCCERYNGQLLVREILCWQSAFKLVLCQVVMSENGTLTECRVDVWAHLVEQDSPLCVAGSFTGTKMRRLIISGKGQEGNGSRRIWTGGYELVMRAVDRVIDEYCGLDYEKQGFCPDCLASRDLRDAQLWNWVLVEENLREGKKTMTCRNGHEVDIRHVGGRFILPRQTSDEPEDMEGTSTGPRIPFSALSSCVILVGLYDGKEKRIINSGSGFVVDGKRGLIVTAAHTLIDTAGEYSPPGTNYFGLLHGRAVIGVIPEGNKEKEDSGTRNTCEGTEAYFRYFAEIVEKNAACIDACVLRITARIRGDVGGDGSECGIKDTVPLLYNEDVAKQRLKRLKVSMRRCEYEEEIRIMGYNQGGEGLVENPRLSRVIDVSIGHVSKVFSPVELYHQGQTERKGSFRPRSEIVVNCLTIGGHSGGPCVNQAGEVIGILSRVDPVDRHRCYLVPSWEFMDLVSSAKRWFR